MAKDKKEIYKDCKVVCACGATFDTQSTKDEIHVIHSIQELKLEQVNQVT